MGELPRLFNELLPADLSAARAALFQLLFHDVLGGNAGMVGAGNPECVVTEHPVVTHLDVLQAVVQTVAHVQNARHVRRRDDDDECLAGGAPARTGGGSEQTLFEPVAVDSFLVAFRIKGLAELDGFHVARIITKVSSH